MALASLGFIGLGTVAGVLLSAFGQAAPTAAPTASPSPAPAPTPAPSSMNGTPILVELFTSEGCSSCPSADAVATKLERTQPVAGARIIVLAHHVDYWNSLGWPDPWSSSAATSRQRSYAPLHAGAYTPQAVIDGRTETVGSRASLVESMIADAAKTPHVAVDLDVTRFEKNLFDVSVRVGAAAGSTAADTETLIAVVQDRGRTVVPAGENSGKTLDHTSIVRNLTAGPKARVSVPAAVNAPDGTTFSVVAFVQERSSRKILGSNAARLP